MIRRLPIVLAGAAAALLLTACQERQERVAEPGARRPGEISVPFRNRWWHFYERGLSWADAGDDARAIDDFRQCLRLRRTDARLARTYGMHFVQCFAHRELGAALLRRGDLDGAERELELSMAQEPSAKAEHLLRQVRERRGGVAAAPAEAAPAAVPHGRFEIASVAPAADAGAVQVSGRVALAPGTVLWSSVPGRPAERVAADAGGAFAVSLAPQAALSLGPASGPDPAVASVPVAPPAAERPGLELDGPDAGAVVADGSAWYRWRADAAAGLAELRVEDADGLLLARQALNGLRAAGTLRVAVPPGERTLRFSVGDRAGGAASAERRVASRAAPHQDRSLRAVALALPLQEPRPGAMRPGDDPRLLSALVEDGRFRFVDQRADGILARELALVEAGYVDRATAAAAGRRLSCRYVIAGTMARGERDAECFLRLIHCDSGRVVASADAYAELAASGDADAFFAAVAGRLRQVFPVLSGTVRAEESGTVRLDFGPGSTAVALLRLHVFPDQPAGTGRSGTVEVVAVEPGGARAIVVEGSAPASGTGVSE